MPNMERPAQRANAVQARVEVATTDKTTLAAADDVPAQLRRRREASLRLPPLLDGVRDPWLSAPRRPLSRESALAAWGHLAALGLGSDVVASALGLREVA